MTEAEFTELAMGYLSKAKERGSSIVSPIVSKIEINNSMYPVGTANLVDKKIKLNYRKLVINIHQLMNVVFHEYAHLIVDSVYGETKIHGRKWKEVMAILGFPNEKSHVTGEWNRDYEEMVEYECSCGKEHQLTKIRHHKSLIGEGCYCCPECRGELKPKKITEADREYVRRHS